MNRRGTNRKTELIIWGVSGLLVLVLPIGAVMLEGKTKSTKKPTTAQKSEQKNATRPAATSPARAVSRRPFVETEPAPGRSDWYSGVVPVTPVAAKQDVERSTVATPAPVNSAPFITEASTPEIRDSSATPASVGPGSLNPVETASAVGTISTGDASLSSMGPLATEPSVTVELPMQAPEKPVTTPAVVQMPDHTPAMSDPDSSVAVTIPEPEMLEERERVEITLIRPKSLISPMDEQVIFRTDLQGYSHAFVLVRSRRKGELWWAQGVTVRQGPFFRARARFGNAKSVDGSLYKMTLAFVKSIDELPEDGTVYEDIPAHFLLSQEFDITLKK